MAVFLGCTNTGRLGLCFMLFYVQELPKAQPAMVLVLRRLRRRGNGLKSHPTDWEKLGIEPATPGLQDIGLSPTSRRLLYGDLVYKLKKIVGSNNFSSQFIRIISIIKRLSIILMYYSRLHAWWSTQSRSATLLSSLIARRWVGLQTLWRFRLKDLSIDEMAGACLLAVCLANRGLPVGFLLLWYSVFYLL